MSSGAAPQSLSAVSVFHLPKPLKYPLYTVCSVQFSPQTCPRRSPSEADSHTAENRSQVVDGSTAKAKHRAAQTSLGQRLCGWRQTAACDSCLWGRHHARRASVSQEASAAAAAAASCATPSPAPVPRSWAGTKRPSRRSSPAAAQLGGRAVPRRAQALPRRGGRSPALPWERLVQAAGALLLGGCGEIAAPNLLPSSCIWVEDAEKVLRGFHPLWLIWRLG